MKSFLLEQNDKEDKLFIVVKQDARKAYFNTQVVLNPKVKNKVRKWLVKIYQDITFLCQTQHAT